MRTLLVTVVVDFTEATIVDNNEVHFDYSKSHANIGIPCVFDLDPYVASDDVPPILVEAMAQVWKTWRSRR